MSVKYIASLRAATTLICLICTAGCATISGDEPAPNSPPALRELRAAIDEQVQQLGKAVRDLAKFAENNSPESPLTRTLIQQDFVAIPATVFIIDDSDVPVSAVATGNTQPLPWSPTSLEPVEIGQPQLNPAMLQDDGLLTFDVVMKTDTVSVIVRVHSQTFLQPINEAVLSGTNIDSWIMQPNGMQLYEPDLQEVGRNLITDPLYADYPRLREIGRRMKAEPSGIGAYDFLTTGFEDVVEKRATWDTLTFGETEWRIVIVQLQLQGEEVIFPDDSDVIFEARDMKKSAHTESALQAFYESNEPTIRDFFKRFLAEHKGIYNVAHVTTDGNIVFGEPVETSFDNYDLTEGRRPNDAVLLEAARAEEDTWLVFDLAEGDKGLFYVLPIRDGDLYHGAIYMIWVLPEA